jgi:hypothetical protein
MSISALKSKGKLAKMVNATSAGTGILFSDGKKQKLFANGYGGVSFGLPNILITYSSY